MFAEKGVPSTTKKREREEDLLAQSIEESEDTVYVPCAVENKLRGPPQGTNLNGEDHKTGQSRSDGNLAAQEVKQPKGPIHSNGVGL